MNLLSTRTSRLVSKSSRVLGIFSKVVARLERVNNEIEAELGVQYDIASDAERRQNELLTALKQNNKVAHKINEFIN